MKKFIVLSTLAMVTLAGCGWRRGCCGGRRGWRSPAANCCTPTCDPCGYGPAMLGDGTVFEGGMIPGGVIQGPTVVSPGSTTVAPPTLAPAPGS